MNDKDCIKLLQYQRPPAWMEWSGYFGALAMLAAGIVTEVVWFYAGVTGMLLYWNYKLFDVIKQYVDYVNATEINKLFDMLAENERNKQKDGTFQDRDGLNKERENEGD